MHSSRGEGCKMYCAQIQYRHTCTYRSQQGNPLLFAPPLVSQVEHEEEDREESRNGVEESRQLETINFRVGKRSMMEDESRNTMKFLSSAHICHTHACIYTSHQRSAWDTFSMDTSG